MYDTFRRTRVNVSTILLQVKHHFFHDKATQKEMFPGPAGNSFFLIQAFLHGRKCVMQILKNIIIMINVQF